MERDLATFHAEVGAFQQVVEASGIDAADRYVLFKTEDPFTSIPPALLHSGHLASYAITTGMIDPFDVQQLTKPATYLVPVEGECRYCDEKGILQSFYLSRDPAKKALYLDVRDHVRLAPNSVCFLTLAPEFRMPSYIAARFNLLIRDVYRGLLVGTGPLVDPGFTGKLSIPIHNFTSREYFIEASEGLVYFEFTKMSWTNPSSGRAVPSWLPSPVDCQPPFPASKSSRRGLDDYLRSATGGGPPASAIGPTMAKMSSLVSSARFRIELASVVGIAGIVAFLVGAWSIYLGAQQFTASAATEIREANGKIADQFQDLQTKIRALEDRTQAMNAAVSSTQHSLEDYENKTAAAVAELKDKLTFLEGRVPINPPNSAPPQRPNQRSGRSAQSSAVR
jgi:deoxycytidine triphosphate deaminase